MTRPALVRAAHPGERGFQTRGQAATKNLHPRVVPETRRTPSCCEGAQWAATVLTVAVALTRSTSFSRCEARFLRRGE
jgi:hypothetical protein